MKQFAPNKIWKPYSRLQFFMLFLLFFSLFASCAYITPKTETLKHVHDTYRQEFIKLIVSPPSPRIKSIADDASFVGTLAEIRAFKSKYGEAIQEAHHLDVLEAMIYLQTNQFGMARLMEQKVKDAASKLQSKTGIYTRDQLFALSFDYLLSGWEEIQKAKPDAKPDVKTLRSSAEGINKVLAPDPDKFDPKKYSEADDGAIYLATTAAIFYTWVYDIELTNKADLYIAGSSLIGKFLSESEKKVAEKIDSTGLERNPRLRYIQWYNYLKSEAGKP